MDTLPASSSVTKTPALFSSSASATFHSRLTVSSSSSQRRLRALSARTEFDEILDEENIKSPLVARSVLSSAVSSPTLPVHMSEKLPHPQKRSLLYYAFVAYCFCSTLFLSYELVCATWDRIDDMPRTNPSMSPINEISRSHLLTKLLPSRLHPVSFQPIAFSAPAMDLFEIDITACSWLELQDLIKFEDTINFWKGPISIVVLADGSSEARRKLYKALKKTPNIRRKALIHTIEQLPTEGRSPNLYLNLARLFSRTSHVMLLPTYGQISNADDIYLTLTGKLRSMNQSQRLEPRLLGISNSSSSTSSIPPSLTPLLIEREHPIWCTERFFTASRESDWQECVWLFWLYSYGTIPYMEANWEVSVKQNRKHATKVDDLVHRRLSNRFKHETCMLAANTLKEKSLNPLKVDPQKAQWLRKACKEAVNWDEESP